jgi:hypothetical protein
MRSLTLVAAVAGLGLAWACPAAAMQQDGADDIDVLRAHSNTLYGPVGLITVPTAYVERHGGLLFGTFLGRDKSASGNYGLTPGIDVGATYLDRRAATDKILGNVKVNIVPQNFKGFELGIGAIDVADDLKRTLYAVVSADWATPDFLARNAIGLRLHAGVGNGLFRDRIIGGGEVVLNRKLSAIGEYNGTDVNAALQYAHDATFRVQIGVAAKNAYLSTSYDLRF